MELLDILRDTQGEHRSVSKYFDDMKKALDAHRGTALEVPDTLFMDCFINGISENECREYIMAHFPQSSADAKKWSAEWEHMRFECFDPRLLEKPGKPHKASKPSTGEVRGDASKGRYYSIMVEGLHKAGIPFDLSNELAMILSDANESDFLISLNEQDRILMKDPKELQRLIRKGEVLAAQRSGYRNDAYIPSFMSAFFSRDTLLYEKELMNDYVWSLQFLPFKIGPFKCKALGNLLSVKFKVSDFQKKLNEKVLPPYIVTPAMPISMPPDQPTSS